MQLPYQRPAKINGNHANTLRLIGTNTENEEKFLWSTVQAFKGLEAVTVILLGIESIDDSNVRRLVYVGGSRARSMLTIFLQEDQAESVQNTLANIIQYLT